MASSSSAGESTPLIPSEQSRSASPRRSARGAEAQIQIRQFLHPHESGEPLGVRVTLRPLPADGIPVQLFAVKDIQIGVLPVELEHAAVSEEKDGAVPRADPVEQAVLQMNGSQRGAAPPVAGAEHRPAGFPDRRFQKGGDIRSRPRAERLAQFLHRDLAGGPAAGEAPHAVGQDDKQTLPLHGLRIGGIEEGEGVLLRLPPPNPLDVGGQDDRRGFRLRRGGGRRFFCGQEAGQGVPLPASSFFHVNRSPQKGRNSSLVSPKSMQS